MNKKKISVITIIVVCVFVAFVLQRKALMQRVNDDLREQIQEEVEDQLTALFETDLEVEVTEEIYYE